MNDRVFWGGSRVDSSLGIPPILDLVFWGGSWADSPLGIPLILDRVFLGGSRVDVDAALSFLEKFDEEVLYSSFEINRETCLVFSVGLSPWLLMLD
jgi:hypothetical protein